MESNFFENIGKRSTRFQNVEVEAEITTKNKVVKIQKSSKGTKVEVIKK